MSLSWLCVLWLVGGLQLQFPVALSTSTCGSGCTAPWQLFRGMCLWWPNIRSLWQGARARNVCLEKGGDLVWLHNSTEHSVIREFVRSQTREPYAFFIGLFRVAVGGPLIWTGGNSACYRGTFSDDGALMYVAWPAANDEDIMGFPLVNSHQKFLCRFR